MQLIMLDWFIVIKFAINLYEKLSHFCGVWIMCGIIIFGIIIFIDKILISCGFGTTISQCVAIRIYNHLVWSNLGPVCYCWYNSFQCLNNITFIFTLFHLHVFPKNTNNVTRNLLLNGLLYFVTQLIFVLYVSYQLTTCNYFIEK